MKFFIDYREENYYTAEVYAESYEEAEEIFRREWRENKLNIVDEGGTALEVEQIIEDEEE